MTNMTYAPIPKLRTIGKAILNKRMPLNLLAKSWLTNNEKGYWFSRTTWSIYLIIKCRLKLSDKNHLNLWLPDYFCNEATIAIRSLGIKLSFYPILLNGKPDLLVCNRMLDHAKPDVIVYVNYFGESLFSKELADIAKKSKAWFVEDSAHCLMPEKGIRSYGDFIIYSPHKLLSIPDGALLVISDTGPSRLSQTLLQDCDFDYLYSSLNEMRKSFDFMPYKWLSKRLIQKTGLHRFYNVQINSNEIVNIEQLPHPKMSRFSQKLLSVMLNLDEESNHRKSIQKQWSESISNNLAFKGLELEGRSKFTPYLVKVTSKSDMTAQNIIDLLKNSKIPITTWPDLPPEVIQNPDAHKNAIDMSLAYVFFPVHSSINIKNLKSVAGSL